MKPQNRLASFVEATQNIAIGYGISVGATYIIGRFAGHSLGIQPSVAQAALFGLPMTLVSVARSYGIRRWNEYRRGRGIPPDFLHAAQEIADERWKQITRESYTLDHDDRLVSGELASGAAAYCLSAASRNSIDGFAAVQVHAAAIPGTSVDAIRKAWRRNISVFKPTYPRRDLIKAGAMIVAEIGRIDRASAKRAEKPR